MKMPRYIVIKLETVDKDTVKATEITDRCKVYEYEADETKMPRCSINGTPFDECGFCEYFNCDTCKCEADRKE